jgi:hypothetical protein
VRGGGQGTLSRNHGRERLDGAQMGVRFGVGVVNGEILHNLHQTSGDIAPLVLSC